MLLHRRLALTALVAPGTFLPGVHGVIAAEVAAPGPESRGRHWWCARGCCDHMDSRAGRRSRTAFTAPPAFLLLPTLLLPCFTATASSFHSPPWMSQLMLSHPSLACGIALLLSLGRFVDVWWHFMNLTLKLFKLNQNQGALKLSVFSNKAAQKLSKFSTRNVERKFPSLNWISTTMTDSVAFLPFSHLPFSLEPQIGLTDSSPPSPPSASPETNIVWQILADGWHCHCTCKLDLKSS